MANFADELLETLGLKFEVLTPDEKKIYEQMLEHTEGTTLTIESLRVAVMGAKAAVEHELANYDIPPKKELFLKARLRNYLWFEAILTSPERAKAYYRAYFGNVISRKQ